MRYFAIILALVLACGTLQGQDKGKQPDYSYAYPQLHRYQRGTVFDLSEKLLNRKYMYRVNDPWLDVSKEFRKINRSLGPARYENYRLDKPLPLKKGKLYLVASDGENNSLFAHYSGIYLGEYRQEKGKPTFIREGIGIDKTRIRGTETAKYYIGYYKKNKRHGLGFYVDPKGNMYAGEWKRGRLIGKTKRALTPEESEKIGDYVRKINNLL